MTSQESMIDIGNSIKLCLYSMGQGSPTIILDAPGPGVDSSPWAETQPRLAQSTRTCRYDRAGTGKSTGIELSTLAISPRTQDLEKLLEAASIELPYVMAGYSFGGAIVLRYAFQHLDLMAGLVLVEGVTESLLARITNETASAIPNTNQTYPLGNLPLAVITIDTQEYVLPQLPNITTKEAMKIWLDTQAELVTLSTRGKQVFVKNANHYGVLDSHAEDVVRTITMVVDEAQK